MEKKDGGRRDPRLSDATWLALVGFHNIVRQDWSTPSMECSSTRAEYESASRSFFCSVML